MPYATTVDSSIKRQVEAAAAAGRLYTCSVGITTLGTGPYIGLSIFNPASGRKFVIVSAKAYNSTTTNFHRLHLTTTDPALGTGVTIANNFLNGPASVASGSMATQSVSSGTGTLWKAQSTSANASMDSAEFLTKEDEFIILPGAKNNGALLLVNGAAGNLCYAEFVWAEI